MKDLKIYSGNITVRVMDLPDKCPICGLHMIPCYEYGSRVGTERMVGIFSCTNNACQEIFMAYYEGTFHQEKQRYPSLYALKSLAPKVFKMPQLDRYIIELSEGFFKIYNQAAHAESLGLDQICGSGYRKSLEYLVKDYLIHKDPDREDEIKAKLLMPCINSIEDENIKFAAQRATWIGNDETHYVRKWEEKDVTDLKLLIDLTMNYIKNELIMEKFKREMSDGR